MSRYLLIIFSMIILSGCSELKVIGNAAMREFRAEGMNVEQISYNYHAKLAEREKAGLVMMANAETRRIATDGRMVGDERKIRIAKTTKRGKGLWEKNSI